MSKKVPQKYTEELLEILQKSAKNKHFLDEFLNDLLTPKEYKLLDALITHPSEVVTRRSLIDHAWGPDFKESNNELNVHIKYLRNKIDNGKNKPLIHTIRGVGFVLKE